MIAKIWGVYKKLRLDKIQEEDKNSSRARYQVQSKRAASVQDVEKNLHREKIMIFTNKSNQSNYKKNGKYIFG